MTSPDIFFDGLFSSFPGPYYTLSLKLILAIVNFFDSFCSPWGWFDQCAVALLLLCLLAASFPWISLRFINKSYISSLICVVNIFSIISRYVSGLLLLKESSFWRVFFGPWWSLILSFLREYLFLVGIYWFS